MKITEQDLRKMVRRVLSEEAGPAVLKKASTAMIQAINDDNFVAFWTAISSVLEGMIASLDHVPGDSPKRVAEFKNQANQLLSTAGGILAASKAGKPQQNSTNKKVDLGKRLPPGFKAKTAA
jgi:BRCT domain type II-containing protein